MNATAGIAPNRKTITMFAPGKKNGALIKVSTKPPMMFIVPNEIIRASTKPICLTRPVASRVKIDPDGLAIPKCEKGVGSIYLWRRVAGMSNYRQHRFPYSKGQFFIFLFCYVEFGPSIHHVSLPASLCCSKVAKTLLSFQWVLVNKNSVKMHHFITYMACMTVFLRLKRSYATYHEL